jgi:predicted aspartyl protease
MVEGTPMDFLVDTGAEHSVLKHLLGKIKNKRTIVIGVTGQKKYPWTTAHTVDLGKG